MLGDVLRKNIGLLSQASTKSRKKNAFWVILRDIAVQEIIEYGQPIDSDIIIPLYYDIICEHIDVIPNYFTEILPSNNQERFRVIIRNLFSTNAFHPDGLANQDGIYAYKETNENRNGERTVYQKEF